MTRDQSLGTTILIEGQPTLLSTVGNYQSRLTADDNLDLHCCNEYVCSPLPGMTAKQEIMGARPQLQSPNLLAIKSHSS